jgi:transposase
MLDNANYHKGVATRDLMTSLNLPVLFLGPYQFRMQPIELVFNFIKDHDLNPLKTKTSSW